MDTTKSKIFNNLASAKNPEELASTSAYKFY